MLARNQLIPGTMSKETTHFGYQTVPSDEKARHVQDVFDSVASNYDIMNDLMSGGLHRLWKRYTVDQAAARPGQQILDLAGGTGDLARKFAPIVGPKKRLRVLRKSGTISGVPH